MGLDLDVVGLAVHETFDRVTRGKYRIQWVCFGPVIGVLHLVPDPVLIDVNVRSAGDLWRGPGDR